MLQQQLENVKGNRLLLIFVVGTSKNQNRPSPSRQHQQNDAKGAPNASSRSGNAQTARPEAPFQYSETTN